MRIIFQITFCSFLFLSNLFSQTNYALTFSNSASNHIIVPYTDTLQPKSALTIEAWLNVNSWSGVPGIVGNTEFGGYELELEQISGIDRLHFWVMRNGNYADAYIDRTDFGTGWHHVAGTFDGRYAKIYLDGILKYTNDAGGTFPIQYYYHNSLIIGAEASSGSTPYGNYFSGSIDEVRIWSIARSVDSISVAMNRELSGSEAGLVGYWNFNEGSGITVYDATIYHGNGTLVNNPTWLVLPATLPVELSSFTAVTQASSVELKWKTATEVSNYGFEIERSEKVDGKGEMWSKIGFVEGAGTTNVPKEYSFTDKNLSSGKFIYRLKQIDRDGQFKYSQEVETEVTAMPQTFALEQNYPNPFNPSTMVNYQLTMNNYTTLKVYDVVGREVVTLVNEIKASGSYEVKFDASKLSSGIYFYQLTSGNFSATKKFMLMK